VAGITNVLTKSIGTSNPHTWSRPFRGASWLERYRACGGNALEDGGRNQRKPPKEKAAASEGD